MTNDVAAVRRLLAPERIQGDDDVANPLFDHPQPQPPDPEPCGFGDPDDPSHMHDECRRTVKWQEWAQRQAHQAEMAHAAELLQMLERHTAPPDVFSLDQRARAQALEHVIGLVTQHGATTAADLVQLAHYVTVGPAS